MASCTFYVALLGLMGLTNSINLNGPCCDYSDDVASRGRRRKRGESDTEHVKVTEYLPAPVIFVDHISYHNSQVIIYNIIHICFLCNCTLASITDYSYLLYTVNGT